MKTYTTSGTGGGQTLTEIETDKIPVYNSREDVEADLANLTEGQIVATADTGNELAQPVDVVEEGNLHAVSSNAVANALSYDLLWTNSSPNSTFADQTITAQTLGVDLSQYKSIKIYFKFATGDNSSFFQEVLKNKATRLSAISDYMFTREVMFTDSGITFGKGGGFTTYGGSRSDSNAWVIPLEIYGVR